MKNFGLRELLLVDPRFDHAKAKVFATHGKDVLDKAKRIRFNELEKFDLLIGTTAISATDRSNVVRISVAPQDLARIVGARNSTSCLVLGREATGLTNEELKKCDIVVNIDTPTQYKTLNISHALAVILYSMSNTKGIRQQRRTISKNERKLLTQYAMELAKTAGLRRHKAEMLQVTLKRMFGRSTLTSKEAMLIVTLFRAALLTIKRKTAK